MRFKMGKGQRRQALVLLIIVLIIVAAYLVMRHFGITDLSREEIQAYVESTGAIAPLVFILLTFVQVTLIPIPSFAVVLAGNYVFGWFWGFIYSYIGQFVGSMVAYLLGKIIGRPFVNWMAGGKEKVDSMILRLKGRENVLLFFMFLFPAFPDDLLCAVAGILPTKPLTFIIMQLVTRATSIAATIVFMSGTVQGWAWVICVIAVLPLVPLFFYCYKNPEKVSDFFISIGRKITGKKPPEAEDLCNGEAAEIEYTITDDTDSSEQK